MAVALENHLSFNDVDDLKKLKFSKWWLKKFTKEHKIIYTKRKSNQIKFTDQELVTLREPIDKWLLENGFSKDRVCNLDETGQPLTESHQQGTFTTEGEDLEKFKSSCISQKYSCFLTLHT